METGDYLGCDSTARVVLAKAKAHEIWQKVGGGNIPVVLNDIVKAFDIFTKGEVLSDTLSGSCMIDGDAMVLIVYNVNNPRCRQRFTVAHELGHIILEHISAIGESSQYCTKSQEREADAFAGELLIPAKDLRAFMKQGNRTFEEVVTRYDVSRDAATIAIKDNKLLTKLQI